MNRESPCVSRLLGVLTDHDVDFVLAGSVAVEMWGVDVGIPGDLDIISAKDHLNLNEVDNVLRALQAKTFPVTGTRYRDCD